MIMQVKQLQAWSSLGWVTASCYTIEKKDFIDTWDSNQRPLENINIDFIPIELPTES